MNCAAQGDDDADDDDHTFFGSKLIAAFKFSRSKAPVKCKQDDSLAFWMNVYTLSLWTNVYSDSQYIGVLLQQDKILACFVCQYIYYTFMSVMHF